MFSDKNITIFGGTGSIGTLIAKSLLTLDAKPRKINLFSNNENELWESKNYFAKLPTSHDYLDFIFGDIRDKSSVKEVVKDIDYVFNCAAMKHVGFCESAPFDAVQTNILGLQNILNACKCQHNHIKLFVQISTDKAVEPVSVMGATKLIGERMVKLATNSGLDTAIIRFGNVLGSRGSLVPKIEDTLKNGSKRVYVSDPAMKRYFLSQEHVAAFILKVLYHVNENKGRGNIYIPKMTELKILDVVADTCLKNGIKDPDIIYYGYDSSEKLSEALISQSEVNMVHEFKHMYILGDLL